MARLEKLQIGANDIVIEEDLTVWTTAESITADDVTRGHEVFTDQHKRYGYVLILGVLRNLGSLPPAARKIHSQWQRELQPYFIVALSGGGLIARTLVRLVLSAGQLAVGGDRTRFEYFATEAEARTWLSQQRDRVRGLLAAGPASRS